MNIQTWLKRIVDLERKVAALPQQSGSGGGGTVHVPKNPKISRVTPQGSGEFRVEGSDFRKSYTVHIRVTNTVTLASDSFPRTSDKDGNLDVTINLPPQRPGTVLAFSANDERPDPTDKTGTLWSNTVRITV